MALSKSVVAKVIVGWTILFPGKKDEGEIEFIAHKFYEALKISFDDKTFLKAANMAERETEFFPTIKLMIDLRDSAYQATEAKAIGGQALLTEEINLSEMEIEHNLKKLKVINEMLAGKLSLAEAMKQQEELKFYKGEQP